MHHAICRCAAAVGQSAVVGQLQALCVCALCVQSICSEGSSIWQIGRIIDTLCMEAPHEPASR